MDTTVVKTKGNKRYNRWDEEVISCKKRCGRDTTMLGTGLCDQCWEEDRKATIKFSKSNFQ